MNSTSKIFKIIFSIFFCIFLLFFPVICFSVAFEDNEILNYSDLEILSNEASGLATSEPNINAKHAIVLERNSNRILYGKLEFQKTPMASTTKIATALVVIQNESNLNKLVTVSKKASSIGGSRLGLKENDKITIKDLLFGLMLCSGNDAAICLAENISGTLENFVYEMNLLAKQLNLKDTNFTSPHGLDNTNHYTTAYELAVLTNYALSNKTFSKLVQTQSTTIHINSFPKSIKNTNELLGYYPGVYGVKTGFTNNAGRCLVTSTKQNDLDIITIVLGCDSKKLRTLDSLKLIKYVFSNFKLHDISEHLNKELRNLQGCFKVEKSNSIPILRFVNSISTLPLTQTEYIGLKLSSTYNPTLSSKTSITEPIGHIIISYNNSVLKTVPFYLENILVHKNLFDYYTEFLKFFTEICNRRIKKNYLIHNLLKICV